jgi:hypothetical protein
MRRFRDAASAFFYGALALACAAPSASAQRSGDGQAAAAPASQSQPGSIGERLRREIERVRLSGENGRVPPADSFTVGARSIPSGFTIANSVGVADGRLDVSGRIEGSAVVLGGDIVVHKGGVITGDAVSIGGRVSLDGGRVEGEMRSLSAVPSGPAGADRARAEPPRTTWQSIKLVFGWFATLAILGLGIMIFAEANLDGVVAAVERGFSRSFWYGVLAQFVALPGLLVLCVALFVTLIGILLIPFAIVAFTIVVAGLVTLGFLAVARLTGGALLPTKADGAPRGVHLRALFIGLVLYLGLWMLAAAFEWNPVVGGILRGVAIVVTWVAATVGLGAALVSRAGTHATAAKGAAPRRAGQDDLSWQTPTPVTGVAAARRPATTTVRDVP